MAMPNQDESTNEILADARFHRASVAADPRTASLAERVSAGIVKLRTARDATEKAEDATIDAWALLMRADFDLDDLTRIVELKVLAEAGKDRNDPRYRACFPDGLSELLASRGKEQADKTRALVAALESKLPALHAAHGAELLALADRASAAEAAWQTAERAEGQLWADERITRVEVIRTLQKNEGALRELFPGDARKVRSFYRAVRRTKKKALEEKS